MGKTIPTHIRKLVVLRDDYTCQYCGKTADTIQPTMKNHHQAFEHTTIPQLKGDYSYHKNYISFEFDHIIPKINGGSNELQNIILACRGCNRAKGKLDGLV